MVGARARARRRWGMFCRRRSGCSRPSKWRGHGRKARSGPWRIPAQRRVGALRFESSGLSSQAEAGRRPTAARGRSRARDNHRCLCGRQLADLVARPVSVRGRRSLLLLDRVRPHRRRTAADARPVGRRVLRPGTPRAEYMAIRDVQALVRPTGRASDCSLGCARPPLGRALRGAAACTSRNARAGPSSTRTSP